MHTATTEKCLSPRKNRIEYCALFQKRIAYRNGSFSMAGGGLRSKHETITSRRMPITPSPVKLVQNKRGHPCSSHQS